jgi:hypothetical protein
MRRTHPSRNSMPMQRNWPWRALQVSRRGEYRPKDRGRQSANFNLAEGQVEEVAGRSSGYRSDAPGFSHHLPAHLR